MLTAIKEIFTTLINIIIISFAYVKAEVKYLGSVIFSKSFSFSTNILLKLLRIYLDLINDIIAKIFFGPKKGKVPPITDRLLLQSANELVVQIKNGTVCSFSFHYI